MPQMCGIAFRAFQYGKDIMWAAKRVQVKLQWNEKSWEKIFWVAVSRGDNCTLLAPFICSRKMLKMCTLFLGHEHRAHCIPNNNCIPFGGEFHAKLLPLQNGQGKHLDHGPFFQLLCPAYIDAAIAHPEFHCPLLQHTISVDIYHTVKSPDNTAANCQFRN